MLKGADQINSSHALKANVCCMQTIANDDPYQSLLLTLSPGSLAWKPMGFGF